MILFKCRMKRIEGLFHFCLGYPALLHKYRESLVWGDGSSMDGQAHNFKDKIMAGPGCPSQTFTHCHLKKRPKNKHHL